MEKEVDTETTTGKPLVEESGTDTCTDQLSKSKRGECPIPKPGGMVGEILGFKLSSSYGKSSKPP